jgi:hypothetical protein
MGCWPASGVVRSRAQGSQFFGPLDGVSINIILRVTPHGLRPNYPSSWWRQKQNSPSPNGDEVLGNPPALFNNHMKTNRFINLVTVAFSSAAFSTAGCAQNKNMAEASSPPVNVNDAAKTTVTTTAPGPAATVQVATAASPDAVSANWSGIADDTFDMRAHFLTGLKQMQATVDNQTSELTTKRAGMKSSTNTKDWDFAMKEMEASRSYLKFMSEELSKATPDSWDQEKDKASQAWARTQKAYENVKSSTTD